MKTIARTIAIALALIATACERTPPPGPPAATTAATITTPAPVDVSSRPWTLPVSGHAAQPDLIVAPDGRVLLAWIEPDGSGHALKFASFPAGGPTAAVPLAASAAWSSPLTIARGDDWFVNWADTPHIAITADGALWAHWLQKSAAATYAYDVALVRSGDGGRTWSPPVLVNDDGTPTEHGFVSLWPASGDSVGVAWLDGRLMADGGGHGTHATAGASAPAAMMTLRSARFDAAGQRDGEQALDLSTCDCCQTDAVATATGALLVYRDRTAAEIRDIYVTRFDAGRWSPPARVHADDWTMPACPVNGPSIDARGSDVVVGWYTAAGGMPTLKIARSTDAGGTFAAPLTIDSGEALQGRVDVALGEDAAWVLWLREADGHQSLQLARYTVDLSRELQRIEVATLQGRGRGTGFPQLALAGDNAFVVWTDITDGNPGLHGARFAPVGMAR